MRNGGRRPGAGRRPGSLGKKTLDKIAAREFVRQRVTAQLGPIIDAQIANALGIKFLVVRQKSSGRFLRRVGATDAPTHDPDTEIIEVWAKDPSIQAATELLNRALDRVTTQVQLTGEAGGPVIFSWQS